jgi:hypothetical protein
MSNKGINNEETGCTGDVVGMEESRTQTGDQELENRSKSTQKSNNITMTPARATRDITHKQTGEREQSTAKKSCSAQKQGLMAFFGEGAWVPPPSTDGMQDIDKGEVFSMLTILVLLSSWCTR